MISRTLVRLCRYADTSFEYRMSAYPDADIDWFVPMTRERLKRTRYNVLMTEIFCHGFCTKINPSRVYLCTGLNMVLEAVRQNMIGREAGGLLRLLPADDTMQWRTYSLKEPQEVLVIGSHDDYELLACKEPSSSKQFILQYCSQRRSEVVRSWLTTELPASAVEQNMVVDLPLAFPFKYSASSSSIPGEQSDLSVLIQWYFLSGGYDDIVYDIDEYCTKLSKALHNMESQLKSAGFLDDWNPSMRSFDAAEVPESPETRCSPTQGWFTPPKGGSPSGHEDFNYEKVVEFLGNDASPDLLKDLPRPSVTHFVDEENPFQNALRQKLPIGECKDTQHPIYAYMRGWGGHYRVEFYVEGNEQRTQLKTTDVAKHTIFHPFDKAYPEDCEDIGKDGKVRLSLLIKWYFVVAGVADAGVLKEMNNYPERLLSMLRWVQDRMYPTAGVHHYEEKPSEDRAPDEDSTKPPSPTESLRARSWETRGHDSSSVNDVEDLACSIVERVTEHVAGERSRDLQDKHRLFEIDQQLGQLRTERSLIERTRKRRFSRLKDADSVVDTWIQQI